VIHFDEYGDHRNPSILLLHGAGVVDTFCQQYGFCQQFHLIVPHLCGAGESVDELYEPEKQKALLWELLDALGKERIGLIGHSLGAQLALMLACEQPWRFSYAVFLSAWVNPTDKSLQPYLAMASVAAQMLHWRWLVKLQGAYWKHSKEQAEYLAKYSSRLTAEQYRAFFAHTMKLSDYPQYKDLQLPMLALCGSGEVKDMKRSLALLGENPQCRTMILSHTMHDYPMRNAERLNPILLDFIKQHQ